MSDKSTTPNNQHREHDSGDKTRTKEQQRAEPRDDGRHKHFMFGLAYQVTAFFLFVVAFGLCLYFMSTKNWRNALWFGFVSWCFVGLAIALLVQQYWMTELPAPRVAPLPSPSPKPAQRETPIPSPAIVTPTVRPSPQAPTPKTTAAGEPDPRTVPASRMGGSGAPPNQHWPPYPTPYDHIKWTDYTEDYFYDAIWRWGYKPEMGKAPRNITGWCPECDKPLRQDFDIVVKQDRTRIARVYCGKHVGKTYFVNTTTSLALDGIRELICAKLENGQWQEVVKRQIDVRNGRV